MVHGLRLVQGGNFQTLESLTQYLHLAKAAGCNYLQYAYSSDFAYPLESRVLAQTTHDRTRTRSEYYLNPHTADYFLSESDVKSLLETAHNLGLRIVPEFSILNGNRHLRKLSQQSVVFSEAEWQTNPSRLDARYPTAQSLLQALFRETVKLFDTKFVYLDTSGLKIEGLKDYEILVANLRAIDAVATSLKVHLIVGVDLFQECHYGHLPQYLTKPYTVSYTHARGVPTATQLLQQGYHLSNANEAYLRTSVSDRDVHSNRIHIDAQRMTAEWYTNTFNDDRQTDYVKDTTLVDGALLTLDISQATRVGTDTIRKYYQYTCECFARVLSDPLLLETHREEARTGCQHTTQTTYLDVLLLARQTEVDLGLFGKSRLELLNLPTIRDRELHILAKRVGKSGLNLGSWIEEGVQVVPQDSTSLLISFNAGKDTAVRPTPTTEKKTRKSKKA